MHSSPTRKRVEPRFSLQLRIWEISIWGVFFAALLGLYSSSISLWIYGGIGTVYLSFRLLFFLSGGLARQNLWRLLIAALLLVAQLFLYLGIFRSVFVIMALLLADYYFLYQRRPR